jgi:hypothetical protein
MHLKLIISILLIAVINIHAEQPKKLTDKDFQVGIGESTLDDFDSDGLGRGWKPPAQKPRPKLTHKPFPPHWGKPPLLQTKDMRPLPFGFGIGSSTLAAWIKEHAKKDKEGGVKPDRPKRPEPSPEVEAMTKELREKRKVLDSARKELHENLKGKSKEGVAELIKAFRDVQKEKHQELKEAHKKLLQEVRSQKQTGDRRK